MALTVIWSPKSLKGYEEIIDYLQNRWTEREVKNFVIETLDFIERLSEFPKILEKSTKQGFRRGPINKYTIITYRVNLRKKELEIVNIRSSRKKPI